MSLLGSSASKVLRIVFIVERTLNVLFSLILHMGVYIQLPSQFTSEIIDKLLLVIKSSSRLSLIYLPKKTVSSRLNIR